MTTNRHALLDVYNDQVSIFALPTFRGFTHFTGHAGSYVGEFRPSENYQTKNNGPAGCSSFCLQLVAAFSEVDRASDFTIRGQDFKPSDHKQVFYHGTSACQSTTAHRHAIHHGT
ncbi:hypothetical protein HDU77_000518 [Chytriomyces hyalinus]|nr:hypothetical protein HDU77_000518 [Chytriomyces hyalinus]